MISTRLPTVLVVLRRPQPYYHLIKHSSDATSGFDKQKRSFSSSVGGPNQDSIWARFKLWAAPFVKGTKLLYADVVKMRSIKREHIDGRPLSRNELLHIRQTQSDILTAFPLVAFFVLIPTIGYAAPLLGYKYPRQLLSRQFWTTDQESKFRVEDYLERSGSYDAVIEHLRVNSNLQNALRDLGEFQGQLTGHHLKALEHLFATGSSFSLASLSREHLLALSKASLVPRIQILAPWLPTGVLENLLRKRGYDISDDDIMILREGISSLSRDDLVMAAYERGLDFVDKSDEQLVEMIEDWLSMYTVASSPTPLPPSLTLHAPIFKYHKTLLKMS